MKQNLTMGERQEGTKGGGVGNCKLESAILIQSMEVSFVEYDLTKVDLKVAQVPNEHQLSLVA